MPLTIEACTAQHIGDRQEQQDRVAIFPHPKTKGALLAVVADGMGGHTGGALAAEQVLHSANSSFSAIGLGPQYVRDMLESGINDAHDAIRLTRYTSEQDPHSTACLLILQPGQVDWAHCGDSRVYHFRDGKLIGRSVDHSYVMDLVQRGFMTEAQAEEHPNKNILVSCLGDKDAPRIDYGKAQPLVAGDCFLLCTDGLWAYFSDLELGRVLKEKPPRQAAEWLIDAARSRAEGRGDNCSLAIVRLKEADKPPPLGRR
jgi:serine/threonine protein phosphatase PrpC